MSFFQPTPQKYRDVVRFLRRNGWVLERQGKGSHELWRSPAGPVVAVPAHREVSPGVLRTIAVEFDGRLPEDWR